MSSTDNIVEDGTDTFYRVRIRFARGDGWSRWHRASAAARDFAIQGDAEEAALRCWRRSDEQGDASDAQVEVVEITMRVKPVARITPAEVFRTVVR